MRVDFASSWDTNDADPEEEYREPACNKKRLILIGVIVLFLLALGMLIAGSVMLGIGVHKSNETPPSCPAAGAAPYYATLLSTQITYDQVLKDYAAAVATVTAQIRNSLKGSSNGKMMQLDTSNTDPLISILGLSRGDGDVGVMSVAAIIYTTQNAPAPTTVTNDLSNGQDLTLYHIEETQPPNSVDSQMCSTVNIYYNNTVYPSPPSRTSTPTTVTTKPTLTTATPQHCTCPTVTCPTNAPATTPTTKPIITSTATSTHKTATPTTSKAPETPVTKPTTSSPLPTTSTTTKVTPSTAKTGINSTINPVSSTQHALSTSTIAQTSTVIQKTTTTATAGLPTSVTTEAPAPETSTITEMSSQPSETTAKPSSSTMSMTTSPTAQITTHTASSTYPSNTSTNGRSSPVTNNPDTDTPTMSIGTSTLVMSTTSEAHSSTTTSATTAPVKTSVPVTSPSSTVDAASSTLSTTIQSSGSPMITTATATTDSSSQSTGQTSITSKLSSLTSSTGSITTVPLTTSQTSITSSTSSSSTQPTSIATSTLDPSSSTSTAGSSSPSSPQTSTTSSTSSGQPTSVATSTLAPSSSTSTAGSLNSSSPQLTSPSTTPKIISSTVTLAPTHSTTLEPSTHITAHTSTVGPSTSTTKPVVVTSTTGTISTTMSLPGSTSTTVKSSVVTSTGLLSTEHITNTQTATSTLGVTQSSQTASLPPTVTQKDTSAPSTTYVSIPQHVSSTTAPISVVTQTPVVTQPMSSAHSTTVTTKVPVASTTVTTNVPVASTTVTTNVPVASTTVTTKVPVASTTVTTNVPVASTTVTTNVPVASTTLTTNVPVASTTVTTNVPVASTTVTTNVPVASTTVTTNVPIASTTVTQESSTAPVTNPSTSTQSAPITQTVSSAAGSTVTHSNPVTSTTSSQNEHTSSVTILASSTSVSTKTATSTYPATSTQSFSSTQTTVTQPTNSATTTVLPASTTINPGTSTTISLTPTHGVPTSTVVTVNTLASSTPGASSTPTTKSVTQTAGQSTVTPTVPLTTPTSTVTVGQTTPTTTVLPSCQPVTTPTPIVDENMKDVVILIDDSTAVISKDNYNQREYNILMDFDENNLSELKATVGQSVYNGRNGPSVMKGLRSTIGLSGRDYVPRTTILISASSNETDILNSQPYASQLNTNGGQVITLALGGADGNLLAILSAGPRHYFSSPNFSPSQQIADQITALIKGPEPATTVSTTPQPSTAIPIPDLPCHPDVAIIFDRSWAVGSNQEFLNQLNFIADNLTNSWNIQKSAMETELVIYSSRSGGSLAPGPYSYSSSSQFSSIVHICSSYWDNSQPSISGALQYTSSVTNYRRQGRSVNTILFTYSSDYNDIVKSMQYTANLGNLIIISMGQSSADLLSSLSGNVVTGLTYGSDMVQQINTMLCTPSTPKPLPTTHTVTSTQSTTTTNQPTSHTVVTRKPCADCNPTIASIVVAVDAGGVLTKSQFANELSFISGDLQNGWNHYERFGLAGFDDDTHTQVMANFGDIMTSDEYKILVNAIVQQNGTPSIASAMKQIVRNFSPNPVYGAMKTLIFTSTQDPTDINNALVYSKQLRSMGSVILVGLNMQNTTLLTTLAAPADVIAWPDITNDNGIADKINQRLSPLIPFTTASPVAYSSTTNSGSVTSTQGTTVTQVLTSTRQPVTPYINCGRDLILLIDQSNAVPDQKSFDNLKKWLMNLLVPLWSVSPDLIAVAPFGYANKTWTDVGGDFTENSANEVTTLLNYNLFYQPAKSQGLVRSIQRTSQLVSPRPCAAVILISAYDTSSDVTSASTYADSMKESGRIIITLGVGTTLTGSLKMLSSGPSYAFTSTFDFPNGDLLAQQISEQICNGTAPIIPTTQSSSTQKQTTFTTITPLPTSFSCIPDAAILLDNSGEQTIAEFSFLVNYISSTLVSDWQISRNASESALICADTAVGVVSENAWNYQNLAEFQEQINKAANSFYGGKSSITALISYLNSNLPPSRQDRPLTAIIFTHTSDISDISTSLTLLGSMPPLNLIAVGLGQKVSLVNLQYLTGNAIIANKLDNTLKQQIDAMMCSSSTPAIQTTMTTVASSKVSTSAQPNTVSQTTTSQPTSTITLDKCYNCYPQEENILIIMDNSLQDSTKYSKQQSLISKLISNWNHMERIAFGYYSSSLTQSIGYMDLRSDEPPTVLQKVISAIGDSNKPANIQHSLYQARSIIPLPGYGVQKTVFFTTTSDPSDIVAALDSAHFLQSLGSLTVVGVALPDSQGINQLASPGMAIAWNNLDDSQAVIGQIMNTLTSNTTVTTVTSLPTSTLLTTVGSTQTTVTSATNCDRDVLLLVDQSNAIPDKASFDKLKAWVTTSLVPKWQVSPEEIAVAPYGFANKTWTDIGGDFEETSVAEVNLLINNNLLYMSNTAQGLVRAMEKASQTVTPHGSPAVILISASDIAADVSSAGQYSDSLKSNGATVITLAVGSATTGNLKKLASGDAFAFSSTDYSVSDVIALQISEAMCSSSTKRPRTSTPMITTTNKPTTVLPTSFPCLPDAAILLDNSGEQSEREFENLADYVSSTLVSDWQISPNNSESALIVANAYLGIVSENAWNYQNLAEFQEKIDAAADSYYGGKSSISTLISYLNSNMPPARPDRPFTAIMFTYTSVMSDITNALNILNTMPSLNLIVVGLGNKANANNLQYLSGNVIIADSLDTSLKQQIDLMMCNPSTPAIQTSTTKAATSTKGSTSAPITTTYPSTTAQPVTTVTLNKCANCYPQEENILIIMDNSAQQNATTYAKQQSLISKLISNWNHMERIAFGYYSSSLTQSIGYMDLRSDEPISVLQAIINATQKSGQNADIAHALYQATSIVPLPEYGIQKTVFFTTTSDTAAVQKSLNSAHFLQSLGSLTVVGVALPDSQGINQLASPGMAIAWNNLDDSQDVIGQIMGTLTSNPSTASPFTVPSTPTGAPVTQTTLSGTSHSTVTPAANCDRDVILLIDQSNAIPDQNSFNQMITWITQNLTPKWPVSPDQIAVAPFGYANKTWSDVGGNFEENSAAEVNLLIKNGVYYLANRGQGLTRAMEKASQTATPHGTPAVILISAYDGAADVTASSQYADSLKAKGATVITVAVGPTAGDNLGMLSSGPTFAFTSKSFAMTDVLALQITEAICATVTRKPTTTVPLVTSTVPLSTLLPTSFPCLPDTALLLDNSDLQTQQQFKDLVHYVSSSLVNDWLISPARSEAAIIIGNARFAEMIDGGWEYQNLAAFQNSINSAANEYYGGSSSIYSLLSYYNSTRPQTRDGHPTNAILFTYSSDPTDITRSINLLNQMNAVNLIIVGLGDLVNSDQLNTLSGNTVITKTLDTQLKNTIDTMMCSPTTPLPPITVPTTTALPSIPTSTLAASSPVATSTIPQITTAPFNCIDCYPQEENILLIIDNSAGQDANTFSQQKALLSQLVSNWNHLERISFGFYSNAFTDNIGYGNLSPSEKPALLQAIINSVGQSSKDADIAHALYQATSIVPLSAFGQQKTVFFTTTADPSAILQSLNSSAYLQSLGSMTVVGVALPAGSDVTGLASPGMALAWNNVSDTQSITQQIMNNLGGGSSPPTGVSSTMAPATTPVSTIKTTTNTPICTRQVMLLMDESNSIPDDASFDKLKNWILSSLLMTFDLGPIQVMPVGYADKDWNDMLGGTYDGKYGDLNVAITNMYSRLSNRAPNMASALRKAQGSLSQDGPTTVIIISTSSDPTDIASATTGAAALKTNGNDVITVGIGFTADKLQAISSGASFSFASASYDIDLTLADSINAVLCSIAPTPTSGPTSTLPPIPSTTVTPVVSSTVQTVAPTTTVGVDSTTLAQSDSTSGAPTTTIPVVTSTLGLQSTTYHQCSRNVILLMDESNAVATSDDFNKLSTWITSSLLPQLLPAGQISVLPIGYASKDWNDIMAGAFTSNLGDLQTVITPLYIYQSKQTPNMTRALQKTLASMPDDSLTTVVLISASSDSTDIQSAVTASVPLKTKGNELITVGIGFTPDKLQTISSGASFAFASADYNFKLALTQNIVNAVCPNGPSSSSTPSVVTQTTNQPTTTVPVCTRQVMLLMDESNSIPDDASFAKLKTWILNSLLTTFNIGPIEVMPVGYATQDWNNMMSGAYANKYHDLEIVITNMYKRLSNKGPNMASALRKAQGSLSQDGPTTVIIISTSRDPTDIASAITAAAALKTNGNDVITVGIGFTADKLQAISSGVGFSFASALYDIDLTLAESINSVLCSIAPTPTLGPTSTLGLIPSTSWAPVASSTVQTVPVTTTMGVDSTTIKTVLTTTAANAATTSGPLLTTVPVLSSTIGVQSTTSYICNRKVILLMDDSNAIDTIGDFNKLSTWITSSLLPQLLPAGQLSVLPIGYANKDWNDIMAGAFTSNLGDLQTVITPLYMYQSKQTPNMTRALQKTLGSMPTDSLSTVVLISASSDSTDIQSAATASAHLKTKGNELITVGIGFTPDKLQTISSGASFAFASADYNFKLALTQSIVNAVCPNGQTTNVPSSLSTTPQQMASTAQTQNTVTQAATSTAGPVTNTVTQAATSPTGPITNTVTQTVQTSQAATTGQQITSTIAHVASTQGASSAGPSTSAAPTTTATQTPEATTHRLPSSTAGIPTTSASPCARNIIILMDESNAIPDSNSFSTLTKWITNALLVNINLSVAKVLPLGYAHEYSNNFMNSHYDSSLSDLKGNISAYYTYNNDNVPDMTNGLQTAATMMQQDLPTSVLLISASNNAVDIASATTTAKNLKLAGNDVITLGIGFGADQLQPISSGDGFFFASPSYIIKISVTTGIVNALCTRAPASSSFLDW